MILQQLFNGLTLGCIYALNALGFTLIFGVIRIINFAQIDMAMIGAFCGIGSFIFFKSIGIDNIFICLPLIFILSMGITSIIGIFIERIAFRPIRTSPPLTGLITSIGVVLILENSIMLFFGSDIKIFPSVFPDVSFNISNAKLSYLQIFIVMISVSLMFLLHFFINKTQIGTAMRATAENIKIARLMGINPNRTIGITFAIASALGAAAGVMMGLNYGVAKYDMGLLPGIKSFSAAILGGMGNIHGAVLGGILIGIVESFAAGYISGTYKDVFAFIILILVLLFKPSGLLGARIADIG